MTNYLAGKIIGKYVDLEVYEVNPRGFIEYDKVFVLKGQDESEVRISDIQVNEILTYLKYLYPLIWMNKRGLSFYHWWQTRDMKKLSMKLFSNCISLYQEDSIEEDWSPVFRLDVSFINYGNIKEDFDKIREDYHKGDWKK